MKDFNFFKLSLNKKSSPFLSHKLILLVISLIVFISIYPIYNLISLNRMTAELQRITGSINSSELQQTMNLVGDKNNEIMPLRDMLDLLTSLEEELSRRSLVNYKLLVDLSRTVPNDTTLESLHIFDGKAHITGLSKDKELVAVLASNLRDVSGFYNILIPNITKIGGSNYGFSITLSIEEVNHNENK